MSKLYFLSITLCIYLRFVRYTNGLPRVNVNQMQPSQTPICVTNGSTFILFRHDLAFEEFIKKNKFDKNVFQKTLLELCRPQCDFPCVNVYEPLCAMDVNNNKRDFYNRCEMIRDGCLKRTNWSYLHDGLCSSIHLKKSFMDSQPPSVESKSNKYARKSVPCRKVYNPVCAIFNGVKSTFMNECLVNEENMKRNINWKVISLGACAEDRFSKRVRRSVNDYNYDYIEIEVIPDFGNQYSPSAVETQIESQFHLPIRKPPHDADHSINLQSLLNEVNFQKLSTEYEPSSYEVPAKTSINDQQTLYSFEELEKHLFRDAPRPFAMPTYQSKLLRETVNTCKYGTRPVCAVFDGKRRTFENICELMQHKTLSGQNWAHQHNGECEKCPFKCNPNYEPICVSRNGTSYTLVNECFFAMAMCEDQQSVWSVIRKGKCVAASNLKTIDNHKLSSLPPTTRTPYHHVMENEDRAESTTSITLAMKEASLSKPSNRSTRPRKRKNKLKSRRKRPLSIAFRNFRTLPTLSKGQTNTTNTTTSE